MEIIRKLHYLNFDTGAGAVIMSLFIAQIMNVSIPISSSISLFMAVLVIYTFDHYQDSFLSNIDQSSERLKFYRGNRKRLRLFLVMLILMLVISLTFLPRQLLVNGIILSIAVGAYFGLLKLLPLKVLVFKELFVAIVYSLGVVLPTYTLMDSSTTPSVFSITSIVAVLALINLFVFSLYDKESDLTTMQPNIIRVIGSKVPQLLGIIVAMVGLFLIWYPGILNLKIQDCLVLTLMNLILVTLLLIPVTKSSTKEYLRIVGECAFILPLAVL